MGVDWSLLGPPVDIGAHFNQGMRIGEALVTKARTENALKAYLNHQGDPQYLNALAAEDPDLAYRYGRLEAQRGEEMSRRNAEMRTRAIGETFVHDPAAARTMAAESGDFDLYDKLQKLDDGTRKEAVEFYKTAAPLAYQLRQMNDPAQRTAFWEQAKVMLKQQGMDANAVDQFDPSNNNALDAIIGQARTVDQLISDGKITWHQQGEQPSFATDAMGRPVGSQNPYNSAAPVTPQAGATAVRSVLAGANLPGPVVAGFLGNFDVEAGYGGARGDGGTAHGIAQWRDDRVANFQKVIGKPPSAASPEEQARFVVWEMQNPEAAGMTVAQRDAILAAKTPEEAAALIDQHYERSSGEHRSRRVEAARRHGAPVRVASREEFNNLPSGTEFIAPDGSHRRKP